MNPVEQHPHWVGYKNHGGYSFDGIAMNPVERHPHWGGYGNHGGYGSNSTVSRGQGRSGADNFDGHGKTA